MKIGFIGAGKVGTSMGIYFSKNKLPLSGYFSRSRSSSERASQLTGSAVFEDIPTLVEESTLLFITTVDDQISAVVSQLNQSSRLNKNHTIVHTSGALSTEIFESLSKTGCGVCSLHPIMSFSDVTTAAENLSGTIFTLEGNPSGLEMVKNIMATTDNKFFIIHKDSKILYHAAACILSNYLVTLIDSGFELLKTAGIEEARISETFMPLIMATLGNIEKSGPLTALTGPLVRGDETTISKHLHAIETSAPEYLNLYQSMGLATIDMIKNQRIDSEKYTELKNILKKDETNEK